MDVRWTCYEAKRSTQYRWFSRTHKSHGKSTVSPAQDINIPSGRLFPAIKCPAPMCLSIRDDGARAACLLMLPVAFAARSTQARMKEEEEPYLWSEKYFWLHQGWIHARPEEVGLHKVPRMSNEHLCYSYSWLLTSVKRISWKAENRIPSSRSCAAIISMFLDLLSRNHFLAPASPRQLPCKYTEFREIWQCWKLQKNGLGISRVIMTYSGVKNLRLSS